MTRVFWIAALAFPILLFQMMFLERSFMAINGVTPDLYLLMVVFLALHAPKDKVFPTAFALGILRDCLSETTLGTTAILYMGVSLLLVKLRDLMVKENPFFQMAVVFTATALPNLLYGSSIVYFYGPYGTGHMFGRAMLMSLYTAAAAPFFYAVLYGADLDRMR